MTVQNQRRKEEEETEERMSYIVGVDIRTLQNLRRKNMLPRDSYRIASSGAIGRYDRYVYNVKKIKKAMKRFRDEGIINKRRKW